MALAPSLWWLAAARIIGGITTASFSTASAYLADVTPPEGRAKAYGLIGAAWSAGFVAGPLIGGLLGEWSPRSPFWAAAALSAAAFLYGLVILPESLPKDKRIAFSWKRANPLGALKLLRSHPELTGLASVNFLLWFAHHVFTAVFVLYAAHRYGWGPSQVGGLLALTGVLDIVMHGLVTGRLVERWGDSVSKAHRRARHLRDARVRSPGERGGPDKTDGLSRTGLALAAKRPDRRFGVRCGRIVFIAAAADEGRR